MPRDLKTYTLFIAAPGDIIKEKEVIKKLAEEWNKLQGAFKNVRIETTDWSDAFPEFNNHPQAIINEQIFDHCDFVVAIFWTKFGAPTIVADSGTEEEILRAIQQNKPLMLYFSDARKKPSEIDHVAYERIKKFRKDHQNNGLYKIYDTESDFEEKLRHDLAKMINKIISTPATTADDIKKSAKDDSKSIDALNEEDATGAKYKPYKEVEKLIRSNFAVYWKRLYGIIEPKSSLPNGIKVSSASNNKEEIKKLKEKVADWEKRIIYYTTELQQLFDDVDKFPDDEFKNEIVAKELWTVNGALKNMDAELRRYRGAYNSIAAYKLKATVKNIISVVDKYKDYASLKMKANTISSPTSFGFELLSQSETLLLNVIGKGIRSEILHKLDPTHFPLMTRRSIWGLYFFSNESSEFVVDQSQEGLFRTVHNWDYQYDHFTYYNHVIFLLMKEYFAKHKIKLKEELKYGYANLFLVDIYQDHSRDIDHLRKYKNPGI